MTKKKQERGDNKPQKNKDGSGWKRFTWISNGKLEKFRLNFSRRTSCEVAPLS